MVLKDKPGSFATNVGRALLKPAFILKKVLTLAVVCTLGFMLSTPYLANAEELQGSEKSADSAVMDDSVVNPDTTQGDGLEIGPETIDQAVRQSALKPPTINPVYYDATTISGRDIERRRVGGKTVRSTVCVTLKHGNVVKFSGCDTPKSGTTWKVDLPAGVTVAAGDTVTAYQTLDKDTSSEVTANAEPSKAFSNKNTIQMPVGEIWIEDTSSNLVNTEEQEEALRLVKEANPAIADDIKSVELKIYGNSDPKKARINVTFTDGSTLGEIEAPKLIVKQVTETSTGTEIKRITVVDNVIKGKLQGEGPFKDIKVQIILKVSPEEKDKYTNASKCTTDKNSSKPVEVTVDGTTGEFTYTIPKWERIESGQFVGVTVKEKNKFVSCGTTTVTAPTPTKTGVRDPKRLTDADKQAIDKAIRDSYTTTSGESKLPNGTGDVEGVSAFIEFDKDGNARIISPNDVVVNWVNNEPEFVKNADGTYKLKSGKEDTVIVIPAKDLVENIAPKSPGIAVDTDKGEVTIAPPAYENAGEDTDLASYTITYKDAADAEKSITITRTVDEASGKTTWSADNARVDASTGVLTLQIQDLAPGATITAKAKDNGGLIPTEEEPLESELASMTLETATVSYDRNGGSGDMAGKTLNKGAKYIISANSFTAPENQKFGGWKIGDTEYAAGDEITVKEDISIKAIWQDNKVTVSYDPNGGSGSMSPATVDKGGTYTLADSGFTAPDKTQKFKTWEVNGKEVAPGTVRPLKRHASWVQNVVRQFGLYPPRA
ncbi:MAG: InlB B-repeat-containing protein [Corynebacterium pyruviciproducens]|uniref:InlB B-repeat-containing protein n=1 Tax=Corynebacterium pyruviciproducens TaxID=598660 RepID=UPI00398343A7